MRTIQARVTVRDDRVLTLQLPEDVEPGEHRITILINGTVSPSEKESLEFPVHDCGPWPENLSLRREDMYGDWGR